jgi:uncharacterized protein DUF937
MTGSLLERLHGLVTPDLLSSAARKLDEPECLVAAGLRTAFPALLAGLGSKARSARSLRALHQLIVESGSAAEVLRHPRLAIAATPDSPLGSGGSQLLTVLFGTHRPTVTDLVARSAGLRSCSGEALLELAAPLVLGLLVHRARTDQLGPAGLGELLLGEHDRIARALPPGLMAESAASVPVSRWLGPALALGLFLLVLWGLSLDRRPTAVDQTVGAINSIMAGAVASPDSALDSSDR